MGLPAILTDYWESFLAFAAFGFLHSLCAQEAFKDALARVTGRFFVDHFWRFIYCVASYAALYHVVGKLHWAANPDSNAWLIAYPDWLWQMLLILHLVSIVLLYTAFLQSDYLEFWGVKQMWSGIKGLLDDGRSEPRLRLFGTDRLVVTGLYAWVRHPMLASGLLFLLTSGPSRNNVVFTLMYLLYMLLGAWFEEKRLLRIFGGEYVRYRAAAGAFIPRLSLGLSRASG